MEGCGCLEVAVQAEVDVWSRDLRSIDSPRAEDEEKTVGDTYVIIGEYWTVTLVNFADSRGDGCGAGARQAENGVQTMF